MGGTGSHVETVLKYGPVYYDGSGYSTGPYAKCPQFPCRFPCFTTEPSRVSMLTAATRRPSTRRFRITEMASWPGPEIQKGASLLARLLFALGPTGHQFPRPPGGSKSRPPEGSTIYTTAFESRIGGSTFWIFLGVWLKGLFNVPG